MSSTQSVPDTYQFRALKWFVECFGLAISGDKIERNHRFLEEALELVQSLDCTREEAYQLVDYVYGRPIGKPHQEVGGVKLSLAGLCNANGILLDEAGEDELARVWEKIETVRAKQAAKPANSPLPQEAPATACDGSGRRRYEWQPIVTSPFHEPILLKFKDNFITQPWNDRVCVGKRLWSDRWDCDLTENIRKDWLVGWMRLPFAYSPSPSAQAQALTDILAEQQKLRDMFSDDATDFFVRDELIKGALCYLQDNSYGWPLNRPQRKATSQREAIVTAIGMLILDVERRDREAARVQNSEKASNTGVQQSVWLGMASAPRDGTRILLKLKDRLPNCPNEYRWNGKVFDGSFSFSAGVSGWQHNAGPEWFKENAFEGWLPLPKMEGAKC